MAGELPDDSPLLDPTNPQTQEAAHRRLAELQQPAPIPAPLSAGGPQLEVSRAGPRAYYDRDSDEMRLPASPEAEAQRARGWAPGIPQDIVDTTEHGRLEDQLAKRGREHLIEGPPGHERDPQLNSFVEAFTAIHPLHDTEIAGLKEAAANLHPHERAATLQSLRWAQQHGLTREDLERYGRQRMSEMEAGHEPEPNWFGRMVGHLEAAQADPDSWWSRMRPTKQSIFDIGAGAAERSPPADVVPGGIRLSTPEEQDEYNRRMHLPWARAEPGPERDRVEAAAREAVKYGALGATIGGTWTRSPVGVVAGGAIGAGIGAFTGHDNPEPLPDLSHSKLAKDAGIDDLKSGKWKKGD